MKKAVFISILLLASFSGWPQQPRIESIRLVPETDSLNQMSASLSTDGTLNVTTTGIDPWICTKPLLQNLNPESTVLSFEYFCTKGLDHLEIFFLPAQGKLHSRLVSNFRPSEGWVEYAIDLDQDLHGWGQKGDRLRLDLGSTNSINIQIRNLKFRGRTAREIELASAAGLKKKQEAVLENNLKKYLSGTYTSSVNSVSVLESTLSIAGTLSQKGNLFLCEVPPYQDVTEEQDFASVTPVSGRDFQVRLPRYVERGGVRYDRLLSKWVLAEKSASGYALVSHAHYADKIRAKYDLPEEIPASHKGLGGFSTGRGHVEDLDTLDITSATVNIWITRFMHSAPSADRIAHNYNGRSWYFDRKEVEMLDSTFRTTASRHIVTAAILLIDKTENCADTAVGRLLQHPDCDPAGIYAMPNMTNPNSVNCYAAALDFLASRYSRADKKYGRCNHWIMHNEVDAGWVWTNAGDKTAPVFMDTYIKSMHMCYNIARSYNPHSQVFVTLTHYWAWTSDPKFYPSKDLMEILLQYTHTEGDFQWAVAQHPYPEDLFEPKTWLDNKVSFDFNTPLITFKNLEVLNAWIKRPEVLYQGKYKRTLWLSENGTNARDYSEQSLKEQAAGFAYTWKKMKHLDGIDGFQWHNWFDARGEGGLRIGLRRFPDDEADPGGIKPVWEVFRAAGTPKEDIIFEPYKALIGISNWDDVNYIGAIDPLLKKASFRDIRTDDWVVTDALGRKLPGFEVCGPQKDDRFVGIFYFMTHINPGAEGPDDVTKILQADPAHPKWGKGDHYWGEPESGYYLSYEKWMISRHARELSDAGVDVIIFDVTNDRTFPEVYLPVCETFRQLRSRGEKTPDIAFLGSEISVNTLWKEFYGKGMFPDLWFRWKGRPLILFGQHEIPGRKLNNDVVFPEQIRDFFSIRQSWAWTSLPWYQSCPWGKDKWPWVDHYPQAVGWHDSPSEKEMVPVAVGEHPLSNIGRSFHNFHQPATDEYDLTPYTPLGLFFQEQWNRALEVDPKFVFVTGWNEWSAGVVTMGADKDKSLQVWKFYPGAQLGRAGKELKTGDDYFIDQYNQEYSRDVEPMKGGHTDNYYYQLMANIRKYKGMEKQLPSDRPLTISLNGPFSQWDGVTKTFYDHIGDTGHRNSPGQGQAGPYINTTGRNDIVESKVARDSRKLYFYVKTRENLTPCTDDNWMLLFIDIDRDKSTGWEGYDFVINAGKISQSATSIRSIGSDAKLGPEVRTNCRMVGNQLMIEVPLANLGLKEIRSFEFHWADHLLKIGDINEFFENGDNAPERRANYLFQSL